MKEFDNKADNLASLYGNTEQNNENTVDLYNKCNDKINISVPRQIDFYKSISITPKDKYMIHFEEDIPKKLIESEVDLKDSRNKICGKFKLVRANDNKTFFLIAEPEEIEIENNNNIDYSLCFYVYSEKVVEISKPVKIYVHDTETTDEYLCIDFGTSNTSAGAYLSHNYINNLCNSAVTNKTVIPGDENIVSFDMNGFGNKYAEITPTIVSCADCNNKNNIVYRFGYPAYEQLRKHDFCPDETVFMEIKRWVTDCEKNVLMADSKGNTVKVQRKEIIRRYLLYIIHEAEQQFKCKFKNLHITAPVKLKDQYLKVFCELLKDYNIERSNAIDEGVAVLYSQIDEDVRSVIKDNRHEINKKALIIDCGGGTSDLSSCSYKISYDEDIVDVKIDTSYINGDFNFGGNNLTYRIMQYMKIVYAHYYNCTSKRKKDRRFLLENILDVNPTNIISLIENGKDDIETAEIYKKIYSNLEKAYNDAENTIPTKFRLYESESPEKYISVRNNFYFLWNIADQMKKQFYQYDTISRYTINSGEQDKDTDLYVNLINNWKLTVNRNGEFKSECYPDIVFNAKEIAWLMTGDIYYLVHRFLNKLYEDDSLNEFDTIKLSGQSTNIDTFKNGLKEFLPGKKIKISDPSQDPYELKLICLKGALRYIKALHASYIDVELENDIESIPFDLIAKNETVRVMINHNNGWEQNPSKVRIVSSATHKDFYFRSADNKILDTPYRFNCVDIENRMKKKSIQEIENITNGLVNQDFLDTLNVNKLFVVTYVDKKNWGFRVFAVKADEDGKYYCSEPEFCSFQSDIYQRTFFEGDC